ncbi:MAG: hypothetical protein RTU92_15190, partial [Candidatus Thorarchaeota archaeon]
ETSYDNDINQQRVGLLREVLYDWGTFGNHVWNDEINTDWSLVINHGECEKTEGGEYRRWASWWDWEGGPLCNLVESKRASDYVRLRYSHTLDEYASDPTTSEYDLFTKEYQRHRNGGPDPLHPNTLIVSYSGPYWDYVYDGSTKNPTDQPNWLTFPRELFGWGTENVYDGEIGSINGIFDVTEWGIHPGGDIYWGPHIMLPWPNAARLDRSFEIEGKFWFDNNGDGTGGNQLILWDTDNKLIAILYIYDKWAFTTTSVVRGYVYDENGASIRSVYLKPQSSQAVDWNGVGWHIRGDSAKLMMEFHDVQEMIIGSIDEIGENRRIGYFSYRMWQRHHYGVCDDPGGIDDIHFITPDFDNVLHDDGSNTGNWIDKFSYEAGCRYPIREPSSGDFDNAYDGSDWYYQVTNIPSGTGQRGPFIRQNLPTSIKLSSLYKTQIDLKRIITQSDAQGELHVSLYETKTHPVKPKHSLEDSAHEKPIIDIILNDKSNNNHKLDVLIRYYDDALVTNEIALDNDITQNWNGRFIIWVDIRAGLFVDYDQDTDGPFLLAEWNDINPDRTIGLVAFQATRAGSSPIPDFRIYDIQIDNCVSWDNDLFLSDSTILRSGPKDMLKQAPGPSTEIQIFPSEGDGKLCFLFYCAEWCQDIKLTLDIKPIWLIDPNSLPSVNIVVDTTSFPSQTLSWDPVETYPTYNYLLDWSFTCSPGWHVIEIDVRGSSWDTHDIVAFRGIWLNWDGVHLDVYQSFITSGDYTLSYLIPLGLDSTIDLNWIGNVNSQLTVSIDGVQLLSTLQGPQLYIDLPLYDYSRNTLHVVDITYNGDPGTYPWDCYLKVMHCHYFWMTIEVDHIEDYYPNSVDFAGITNYFESTSHLRLTVSLTPPTESIPDLYGPDYTASELVRLGQIDNYFDHLGDRYWMWMIYGPFSGGWYLNSEYASSSDYDENGWNRWVGASSFIYLFYENIVTTHEWGHAMHCHEGYDEWVCESPDCIYKDGLHNPWVIPICAYHWFETWENTPTHNWKVFLWSYDWWGQ